MSAIVKIPTDRFVLLAEDDPDDQEFFIEAFNEVNIDLQLVVVNNGVELMSFLNNVHMPLPELLFLDLNMPLKSGFESLKELKDDERLRHVPVIIYTTSSHPSDIKQCQQAKAHLYIAKTNSFPQLKKVIQKVLVTDFASNLSEPPKEKFLVFYEK